MARRRTSSSNIPPFEGEGTIIDTSVVDEIESSYLDYSYSVIYSRALPDARDGLKPVHRRILYSMADSGLRPTGRTSRAPASSATSWASTTRTATRRSTTRWCAWRSRSRCGCRSSTGTATGGSPDDSAAASRYTECRLTPAALLLTDGLDEETVDLEDNYDGSLQQPSVLPAAMPNLLVNGTSASPSAWRPT
jgi:DNA gyrase subunit A